MIVLPPAERVLGSAFAYAVLGPHKTPLLALPEVFPPALVVKSRSWQKLARGWAKARARARGRGQAGPEVEKGHGAREGRTTQEGPKGPQGLQGRHGR